MQYFGSHSSGAGKVKVADSSDLLKAQKLQTINNANQAAYRKNGVTTNIHAGISPLQVAKYNAATQQINYGVKYTNSLR
jgi:hypothetical protein